MTASFQPEVQSLKSKIDPVWLLTFHFQLLSQAIEGSV